MSNLMPPSVAIAIATAAAPGPPGKDQGRHHLIGVALFEVEEGALGDFLYRLQVRIVPPGTSETVLIEWLTPRLSPDRIAIGWRVADTIFPALLKASNAATPAARQAFVDALGAMTAFGVADPAKEHGSSDSSSFAEVCSAVDIAAWPLSEDDTIVAWANGRKINLIAMLAVNAVATWSLWAKARRPSDDTPQRFAADALAHWRVDADDTIQSWRTSEGGENADIEAMAAALGEPHARASRFVIPTTATVRPCLAIEPEADATLRPLIKRYRALTEDLPLAGASMLRTDVDGEIVLTARLRARAPWLEPAIDVIDQQLRVQNWAGRPWIAWRPLCLTGPPGVGKSYLARLIGTLADTGCATLDLGGVSDSRTLEGTARGWTSAQPCWPAVMINQTRTANPVLVLEEVEKAGGSARNGTPHATLLTMIERETAARYWDKCLLADVDLSHVCWIMTCNDANLLPQVLRSRLDIVAVDGPGPEHFDMVAAAVLSDIAIAWGVPRSMIPELPTRVMQILRDAFVRTRSVRRLRRQFEAIVATMVPNGRGLPH